MGRLGTVGKHVRNSDSIQDSKCDRAFFFFFRVKTDGWIKHALCAHRYHLFKVKTIIQLAAMRVGSNNHNLVPD